MAHTLGELLLFRTLLPVFAGTFAGTWYRLSRKSAEQWFKERDQNKNQQLDLKEAKGLFRIHGDLEPVFKKFDKDKSGGISVEEYKAHWLSVVTGPQRQ